MAVSHLFFADDILRFAEASEDQISCIKEGLMSFCEALGQQINLQKSSVFFSNNLSRQVKHELSTNLGIKQTMDLGKYVGHFVQHHGRSNKANSQLLQRVRGRLDGWMVKCLS